jgi:hypothetical protein
MQGERAAATDGLKTVNNGALSALTSQFIPQTKTELMNALVAKV